MLRGPVTHRVAPKREISGELPQQCPLRKGDPPPPPRAQGIEAELWRFPDRDTDIGRMINSYLTSTSDLDDACVHLLFSANRWEKRAELLAKLRSGVTVIADRYAFSGVAFTAAKGAPGLTRAWCAAPDQGLPAPDRVIYLELSQDEASRRGGYGGERYEKREMQARVAEEFAHLRDGRVEWSVVDAARDADEGADCLHAFLDHGALGEADVRSLPARQPLKRGGDGAAPSRSVLEQGER